MAEEVILYLQLEMMPANLRMAQNAYWERLEDVLFTASFARDIGFLIWKFEEYIKSFEWLSATDITDGFGLALGLCMWRRRRAIIKAAKEAMSE